MLFQPARGNFYVKAATIVKKKVPECDILLTALINIKKHKQ